MFRVVSGDFGGGLLNVHFSNERIGDGEEESENVKDEDGAVGELVDDGENEWRQPVEKDSGAVEERHELRFRVLGNKLCVEAGVGGVVDAEEESPGESEDVYERSRAGVAKDEGSNDGREAHAQECGEKRRSGAKLYHDPDGHGARRNGSHEQHQDDGYGLCWVEFQVIV